jgi:hypothetical protein
MATRTLFELNRAYQGLWDLVLDFEGDDLNLLDDALKSVEGEIEEKCRNGIGLIRSLDNLANGMKAEAERLNKDRKVLENRIEKIKQWYFDNLDKMGLQNVPTPIGKMSICKAGGKRGIEYTDKEKLLESEYVKVIPASVEIDNDKLRTALESGKTVEGAYLKPQGRYLKIS